VTRSAVLLALIAAYAAGFLTSFFYQRWNPPSPMESQQAGDSLVTEPPTFPVRLAPVNPEPSPAEIPLVLSRDVVKIRSLAGTRARVRGRVFRVGHSSKSNTYFVNFGPSREALTAVIFASAVELFEKHKLPPRIFEGREVEVQGEIKNHPQYGLEIILETPAQIRLLD
jgi:hypothetical protein